MTPLPGPTAALVEATPPTIYKLHAVVFTQGEWQIAQCLEHNIAAQARTNSDLYYELKRVLVAHLIRAKQMKAEPFADIPRAPKRYWEMYKEANIQLNPVQDVEITAGVSPVVELRAA